MKRVRQQGLKSIKREETDKSLRKKQFISRKDKKVIRELDDESTMIN